MFNPFKNFFKNKTVNTPSVKAEDVSAATPPPTYVSKRIKAIPYDDNNHRMAILFVPVVSDGEVVDYLPVAAADNGDGTASIKIDTELNVSGLSINNIKVGSSDSQASGNKFLKTENDGTVHVIVDTAPTSTPDVNIDKWGGTAQTGADLTPAIQKLLQFDVNLSTRASEATLGAVKVDLDSIAAALNVSLSTRASEATVALIKTNTDGIVTALTTLNAKDFATETTLQSVLAKLDVNLSTRASEATLLLIKAKTDNLDVALSTRATEATLSTVKTNLDDVKTKLDSLIGKDYATQTTLAQVKTDLDSILANVNVALSTRASEVTLASVKTDLDSILANFNVALSTRASEATLAAAKADLDTISSTLTTLTGTDFATQTTLAQVKTDLDTVVTRLDVALSTRASEATLSAVKTDLDTLVTRFDVALSTRASEATLSSLNSKDFATQTTLALVKTDLDSILAKLDVNLSTRATETTLGTRLSESDFDTKVGALTETAPATDTASSGLNGRLQRIAQRLSTLISLIPAALTGSGNFKVAVVETTVTQPVSATSLPLPTGAATEATLGTRLADSTFTGRINTQGQKAMSASTPVVIASDQSAVPVSAASLPLPTGAATETTQAAQTTQADFDSKTGSLTETAPASDTASSGLNGRLQRIAQRLSTLISLVPAALTGSGNFKVALTETTVTQPVSATSLPLPTGAATETTLGTRLSESDFDSKTGALTETAPASDTASSGLNGRLQRIAQRLTSLIALLPAALTGSGNFKVALVESTVTQPISAASLPLPTGAATETTLAGVKTDLEGSVSAGNSTTTPLGANGVFTGTFENVNNYAALVFIIFADQNSSATGLEFDWSSDGVNVDKSETVQYTAGTTGLGFNLTVRGKFFRVKFTNGAVAQTIFRAATIYHVNGSGIITRPLANAITDSNFSQTVKAVLSLKNSGTGNYDNIGLGQQTIALSIPVVLPSDQTAIPVSQDSSNKQTYSASITNLAMAATPTDVFTITGSATKTVKITRIYLTGTQTTGDTSDVLLIKRSTANTAGTSTTPTVVPYDSNNAAGTAVVRAYTANPTLGTAVGTLASYSMFIPAPQPANGNSPFITPDLFAVVRPSQPIVLRGTAQVLAINFNSVTVTGNAMNIIIEWTEE